MDDFLRNLPFLVLLPLFLIMTGAVCFAMTRSHIVRLAGLTYFTFRCIYEILFDDYNFKAITFLAVFFGIMIFFFRVLFWLDNNSFSPNRIQMTAREFLFGYTKQEAERRITLSLLVIVLLLLIGDLRLVLQN